MINLEETKTNLKLRFLFSKFGAAYIRFKNKNNYTPYTVSLYEMCEKTNLEYFLPCRNRIFRAAEEDEKLMDFLYINHLKPADINLDSRGIMIFDYILANYFGAEYVARTYNYVQKRDQLEYLVFRLPGEIKKYKTEQLKQTLAALESAQAEMCDDGFLKKIIQITEHEINRRKRCNLF